MPAIAAASPPPLPPPCPLQVAIGLAATSIALGQRRQSVDMPSYRASIGRINWGIRNNRLQLP